MDTYFTIKDVCGLLKVDRSTVLRWIESGRLRAVKPGGGRIYRIRERDLKKFLNKG